MLRDAFCWFNITTNVLIVRNAVERFSLLPELIVSPIFINRAKYYIVSLIASIIGLLVTQ